MPQNLIQHVSDAGQDAGKGTNIMHGQGFKLQQNYSQDQDSLASGLTGMIDEGMIAFGVGFGSPVSVGFNIANPGKGAIC